MFRPNAVPVALALAAFITDPVAAHTPLCACYDNGDDTILCEGGYSDGSSASGVTMVVRDARGYTIIQGRMDENSEFVFDRPRDRYTVLFDAGPGHRIEIASQDIF